MKQRVIILLAFLLVINIATAQSLKFKVIAFYTGKDDLAHASLLHEANLWLPLMAARHHFGYNSATNRNNLNAA